MVAEELAPGFLVVRDSMFGDERKEVGGRVADERGLAKVRIRRDEVIRLRIYIGEVAAAAAGYQYFLANLCCPLQNCDSTPTFTSFDGAHKASGSRAKHHHIELFDSGQHRIVVADCFYEPYRQVLSVSPHIIAAKSSGGAAGT